MLSPQTASALPRWSERSQEARGPRASIDMELENIVANTVLLKAREGTDAGPSFKNDKCVLIDCCRTSSKPVKF